MSDSDFTFKIIAGGEGGVGKTTMLHRYIEGTFLLDTKMTIGVEIFNKYLEMNDGNLCALQLWDFGGQERFRFFLDSFVTGANGAFLMFDLTMFLSFKKLDGWIDIVRKEKPHLPIVLLGAKIDLAEMISVEDEDVFKFMKKYNIKDYIKISSKTGYNVDTAFNLLVKRIMETEFPNNETLSGEIQNTEISNIEMK